MGFYNFFTSESVCSGHPDKICDRISDAILDEVLLYDKNGKVAVETMVTRNAVFLAGEVSAKKQINYEEIARNEIKNLGYVDPELQFTYKSFVKVLIHSQSPEIGKAIRRKGAGDQGMMFGFACRETPDLMPLPVILAHALTKRIDEVREKCILPYLRPDGKSQVTVQYKNKKPYSVSNVVLAVPHTSQVSLGQVKEDLYKNVVLYVLSRYGYSISMKNVVLNGNGVWHFSGPATDTGVTGRKIVVDSYGAYARVGGGAFSGKDPSKVDRSGAYAARFIAKNIVAAGLADKIEVMLAYFIGGKKPVMQEIETFGTEKKSIKIIKSYMQKLLNVSVAGIIDELDLLRPIYKNTSAYGHFGRPEFPWEKIK